MLNVGCKKKGFTLVEVLVVIVIMGTLTSMGVVSLQNALQNNRLSDYALNMAAFLERMANEANRMSKTLWIRADERNDTTTLRAYIDAFPSSDAEDDRPFAKLDVDITFPVKFGCSDDRIDCHPTDYRDDIASLCEDGDAGDAWSNSASFKPRIGLSAAPTRGYVCFEYGFSCVFGGVVKCANKNTIIPILHTGGSWQKL